MVSRLTPMPSSRPGTRVRVLAAAADCYSEQLDDGSRPPSPTQLDAADHDAAFPDYMWPRDLRQRSRAGIKQDIRGRAGDLSIRVNGRAAQRTSIKPSTKLQTRLRMRACGAYTGGHRVVGRAVGQQVTAFARTTQPCRPLMRGHRQRYMHAMSSYGQFCPIALGAGNLRRAVDAAHRANIRRADSATFSVACPGFRESSGAASGIIATKRNHRSDSRQRRK
jgi:hypothetical protein